MNKKKVHEILDIIPPILYHEQIKTIVTHNGKFHSDDVGCVALLKILHPKVKVIRLPHESKEVDDYVNGIKNGKIKHTIVMDVGKVYDGEWLFDHHTIFGRDQNIHTGEYSALGLFWRDCGNDTYSNITRIIKGIDSNECRKYTDSLSSVVAMMNPMFDEENENDEAFNNAVDWMQSLFETCIYADINNIRYKKYIEKNSNIKNNVLYTAEKMDMKLIQFLYPELKAVSCYSNNVMVYYPLNGWEFPSDWWFYKPSFIKSCNKDKSVSISKYAIEAASIAKYMEKEGNKYDYRR